MAAAFFDGELLKRCGKFIKAVAVFEMLTHLDNLPGRYADSAILPVLPTLMFEIWATLDGAVAIGSGSLPIFFGEGAALDGGDVGELFESCLANDTGVGGVHGFMVPRNLGIVKSKKIAACRRF